MYPIVTQLIKTVRAADIITVDGVAVSYSVEPAKGSYPAVLILSTNQTPEYAKLPDQPVVLNEGIIKPKDMRGREVLMELGMIVNLMPQDVCSMARPDKLADLLDQSLRSSWQDELAFKNQCRIALSATGAVPPHEKLEDIAKQLKCEMGERTHLHGYVTLYVSSQEKDEEGNPVPRDEQRRRLLEVQRLAAQLGLPMTMTAYNNPPFRNQNTGKMETGHPRHGHPLLEIESYYKGKGV